jgi:hypothetical protein
VPTELAASGSNVHLLDVIDGENQMRHADAAERAPPLPRPQIDPVILRQFGIGKVDLSLLASFPCRDAHNPGVGQETELSGWDQLQVYGEPAATQRGVSAEGTMRAVGVPVQHSYRLGCRRPKDDETVGANSATPVADLADSLRRP